MLVVGIGVVLFSFTVCRAAEGELGTQLQSRTTNVFIPAGPVEVFLPELIAQLELPAFINLGVLRSTYPDDETKDRRVDAFEFKRGTKEQALDKLVKRHRWLSWESISGVTVIRREAAGKKVRTSYLKWKLDEFNFDGEFRKGLHKLSERIDHLWEQRDHAFPKLWFEAELADSPAWGHYPGKRTLFDERNALSGNIAIQMRGVTLEQVIFEFVDKGVQQLWITTVSKNNSLAINAGDQTLIVQSAWCADRREASVRQLVKSIDPAYKSLHGYRSTEVRIDDAFRELTRRYHFDSETVLKAIKDSDIVKTLIVQADGYESGDRLINWAKQNKAAKLMTQICQLVVNLESDQSAEQFHKRRMLIRSIPEPGEPLYESVAKPVWRKLTNDKYPLVRKIARRVLRDDRQSQDR